MYHAHSLYRLISRWIRSGCLIRSYLYPAGTKCPAANGPGELVTSLEAIEIVDVVLLSKLVPTFLKANP